MIGQVNVAQAVAVVGYDCFANQTWRVAARERRLTGMALTGSAAAGDCAVDLFVDQFYVGRFRNTNLGVPQMSLDMIPLKGNLVPPGATISAIVAVAPTTNAINITLL
ncbi:hypothetical protein ES705_34291 [subsurface metagenome]